MSFFLWIFEIFHCFWWLKQMESLKFVRLIHLIASICQNRCLKLLESLKRVWFHSQTISWIDLKRNCTVLHTCFWSRSNSASAIWSISNCSLDGVVDFTAIFPQIAAAHQYKKNSQISHYRKLFIEFNFELIKFQMK